MSESVVMSAALPAEVWARLEVEAQSTGRSRKSVVEELIDGLAKRALERGGELGELISMVDRDREVRRLRVSAACRDQLGVLAELAGCTMTVLLATALAELPEAEVPVAPTKHELLARLADSRSSTGG